MIIMKLLSKFFGCLLLLTTLVSCEININGYDDDYDNEFSVENRWYDFDDDALYFATNDEGETAYCLYLLPPDIRYNIAKLEFSGSGHYIMAIIRGGKKPREGHFKVGGSAKLYYCKGNPDSPTNEYEAKRGDITIRENTDKTISVEFEFKTYRDDEVKGVFVGYVDEF